MFSVYYKDGNSANTQKEQIRTLPARRAQKSGYPFGYPLFGYTRCRKTRTQVCGLQFCECDGFCAVFIVADEGEAILVQDDGIDETVDQLSAMLQFIGGQFSKRKQKEHNLGLVHGGCTFSLWFFLLKQGC